MIYVRLSRLAAVHAQRDPAYVSELLRLARKRDGGRLWFDRKEWDAFQTRWGRRPSGAPCKRGFGLGDLVYALVHPVAVWLDRWIGTRLATCGACAKRRAWLNAIRPLPALTRIQIGGTITSKPMIRKNTIWNSASTVFMPATSPVYRPSRKSKNPPPAR